MNEISRKAPLHSSNLLYSYLTLCPFASFTGSVRVFLVCSAMVLGAYGIAMTSAVVNPPGVVM
jgi:hypothetical protein